MPSLHVFMARLGTRIFSRQAALRSTSLAAMPFCHLRLVEIKPKNHSYLWKSDLYPLILIGICFLARHVLGAARVRENWFSGLTKHVPTLTRAGLSGNTFVCGNFSPPRVPSTGSLGREECHGARIEPRAPGERAYSCERRGGNVAWFSRSGRFRSQVSGPRRRRVRRCIDPALLTGTAWVVGRARRPCGGESSQPPGSRQ